MKMKINHPTYIAIHFNDSTDTQPLGVGSQIFNIYQLKKVKIYFLEISVYIV